MIPLMINAAAENAIFVLSRNAGEGADRRLEKGDYYLLDTEYALIKAVCDQYENVILIINAGGAIDMNFTEDFPNIKSILYVAQPGQNGGPAIADILLGKVTPSGKLAATWPLQYNDIPFAEEYSNLNGDLDYDYYKQGLYDPPDTEQSVPLCAELLRFFEGRGISVIRLGLHDSPSLRESMAAGAFHPSFRELCESRIMLEAAEKLLKREKPQGGQVNIAVSPKSISRFTGQKKANIQKLSELGYMIKLVPDEALDKYGMYIYNKKELK